MFKLKPKSSSIYNKIMSVMEYKSLIYSKILLVFLNDFRQKLAVHLLLQLCIPGRLKMIFISSTSFLPLCRITFHFHFLPVESSVIHHKVFYLIICQKPAQFFICPNGFAEQLPSSIYRKYLECWRALNNEFTNHMHMTAWVHFWPSKTWIFLKTEQETSKLGQMILRTTWSSRSKS